MECVLSSLSDIHNIFLPIKAVSISDINLVLLWLPLERPSDLRRIIIAGLGSRETQFKDINHQSDHEYIPHSCTLSSHQSSHYIARPHLGAVLYHVIGGSLTAVLSHHLADRSDLLTNATKLMHTCDCLHPRLHTGISLAATR